MTTTAADKMIAKIDALLAKAEDSAATPEEAEALMAKAEELMVKYAIDRAKLGQKDASKREGVEARVVRYDMPKCYFKSLVLFGASALVSAIGLSQMSYSTGRGYLTLYGTKTDNEYTERMIRAMWAQALGASQAWRNTNPELIRIKETLGTNNMTYWNAIYQYVAGFAKGMAEKVAESRRTVVAATTGAELVLVDRKKEIDDLMQSAGLGKGRATSLGKGVTSAYSRGKAAGREAHLGNRVGAAGAKALN